jgi:hypothetical protein
MMIEVSVPQRVNSHAQTTAKAPIPTFAAKYGAEIMGTPSLDIEGGSLE